MEQDDSGEANLRSQKALQSVWLKKLHNFRDHKKNFVTQGISLIFFQGKKKKWWENG